MKNVITILENLRRTSSTNDKVAIIKRNSDNKVFTDILKYTYDDNLQFGFSESKLRNMINTMSNPNPKYTWDTGFDMLNELAKSNINDDLRVKVLSFLVQKSKDEQELWINVLTKDLRCNISGKTINKAIKGLISEFNIQQAYPIHKYPLKKRHMVCFRRKA